MIASINIEQLDRIAQACRRVLSADPDSAKVAIPYLHVLSAHPNSIAAYEDLVLNRSPRRRRIYNALARQALRGLALIGPSSRFSGDPLPARIDVLFISHFLKASQAGDGEDLYFGNLPQSLLKDGFQTAVALIDHSRRSWSKRPNWKPGSVPRILLNRTMGLSAELRIGRKLTGAAKELRSRRRRETEPFIGEFLDHAAANATSPGSFTAMRIGEQVNALVRTLQPKTIVTTFEGHSWERLAFHAARAAKPDIICVGYHHAVLFPFADAMRQSFDHGFDPDHILTAGQVSCDWLRTQPSLKGVPVEILGSVRAPSDIAEAPRSASTCLVIPEGIMSESIPLCRLAIEAARLRSSLNFRLRLHPLINRERLTRAAPDLANLPTNVVWSDVALSADLATCRWALYRGSSTVITATLSGLRPIYFSVSRSEVSIDPLAALAGWREIVSSAEELSHALDTDLTMSDTDRQSGHNQASAYCRRYFMPLNAASLKALLPH